MDFKKPPLGDYLIFLCWWCLLLYAKIRMCEDYLPPEYLLKKSHFGRLLFSFLEFKVPSILYRYKPSEETLLQIDRFCLNTIDECDTSPNRRLSQCSRSLDQQAGASIASTNVSPLPVSSFASGALVKSLNYVRSLVSQYIPKRSFHPAAFAGAPPTSRQSLPTLSSLLSRSFNSQLSPATVGESSEKKDATSKSVSNLSISEKVDELVDHECIADDVLKWRWLGGHRSSSLPAER